MVNQESLRNPSHWVFPSIIIITTQVHTLTILYSDEDVIVTCLSHIRGRIAVGTNKGEVKFLHVIDDNLLEHHHLRHDQVKYTQGL